MTLYCIIIYIIYILFTIFTIVYDYILYYYYITLGYSHSRSEKLELTALSDVRKIHRYF